MKTLIFIFTCACSIALSAQSGIQDLGTFTELKVSGNLEVVLVHSNTAGVNVLRDHEKLKIHRDGNQLKISLDRIRQIFKDDERAAKVEVRYTNLNEVHATAGVSVRHEGLIRFSALELRFGSGATGIFELEGDQLLARTGEGAVLKLTGSTKNLEARSSTGGHLQARDLEAETVDATASTGGMASLFATRAIEADADTGGAITYRGNPEKHHTKESLGGSVKGN